MVLRICNAVLMVAFVALLCGYVYVAFADKKPKLEVVMLRGCLTKLDLLPDTECIVGPKMLNCQPVAVTHLAKCAITRVVK